MFKLNTRYMISSRKCLSHSVFKNLNYLFDLLQVIIADLIPLLNLRTNAEVNPRPRVR